MKANHKRYDHIKFGGKYYQCICADSETAVFAPLIKRNDCLSAKFTNMIALPNFGDDVDYKPAKLIQWDGSGIKRFSPINNSLSTEVDLNKTLRIKTKLKGVLVFKKGQYLNYVNKEVHKP